MHAHTLIYTRTHTHTHSYTFIYKHTHIHGRYQQFRTSLGNMRSKILGLQGALLYGYKQAKKSDYMQVNGAPVCSVLCCVLFCAVLFYDSKNFFLCPLQLLFLLSMCTFHYHNKLLSERRIGIHLSN